MKKNKVWCHLLIYIARISQKRGSKMADNTNYRKANTKGGCLTKLRRYIHANISKQEESPAGAKNESC
jgi:hypothetical protein